MEKSLKLNKMDIEGKYLNIIKAIENKQPANILNSENGQTHLKSL